MVIWESWSVRDANPEVKIPILSQNRDQDGAPSGFDVLAGSSLLVNLL